jgi:YidC/Oxa1 family membrane protein insertase
LAEYRNPQHEPGNERRLLLVFIVTFAILLFLEPLFKKYLPEPPAQHPQSKPTQSHQSPPAPTPPTPVLPPAPAVREAPGVSKQATSEAETVVENDLYRITFTNKGAQVKSWILKKFDNESQDGRLDLVNSVAASRYGYPLSLWTYDETLRDKLSSVLYVASEVHPATTPRQGAKPTEDEIAGQTLKAPATITFEYSDHDLTVRKTFGFDHSYVINIETSVTYKGAPVAAFPSWPGGFGDQATLASYAANQIQYQYDNNIERLAYKKISGGATLNGRFDWAGASDAYFAAVFIPDDPAAASVVTLRNQISIPRDPQNPNSKEVVPADVLGAAVGNMHGPTIERAYIGPKQLSALESLRIPTITGSSPDLRGLIDFGTFGIIARPLFLWLRWTYFHMVPNWGWAIILQTLIITVALMPLRVFQIHSMYKMQKVAPQIKSIQDKYKKYSLRDPRKAAMNEEIAALYKKEGANPVMGCLPMLIQLPFLYGYYRMLAIALDLRHAHWLWIHDLSSPEPGLFRILPIALIVSMLFTQKMTPQAGMDPAQQRMMNVVMPLMMGFIFWNLAAGLSLYYSVSNLISIAQQAVMNRTKLGKEMREMMEKRARKKDKEK